MLRDDNIGRIGRYNKTERASNLAQSQRVNELAIRLTEKESLTLLFTNGIPLPLEIAKLQNLFGLDALSWQIILQKR